MCGNHLPVDRGPVEFIGKTVQFTETKEKGTSHAQWEGYVKGKRRILTVGDFGASKKETCGAHFFPK